MIKIEEILEKAGAAGASDVHLTVGSAPRMRVNGSLVSMPYDILSPEDTMEAAKKVMSREQMEIFNQRGEYDMSFALGETGRYRVNVFRQQGAAALAFRLVATKVPSPEELGVPASIIELSQRKRGLVLVTGPTGSGKSTTLAAVIDRVKPR